jgi:hypothetical protein
LLFSTQTKSNFFFIVIKLKSSACAELFVMI